MSNAEIDLRKLKNAVNAIFDHLIDDLKIEKVTVVEQQDFYWSCPPRARYDSSKEPPEWWTGRLSDDIDFVKLIGRGQSGDASYNLVHLSPLLRYIGETIKR